MQCYLKARCQTCNLTHLEVLHEVNARPGKPAPAIHQPVTDYLDPTRRGSSVLLKLVKVCLYNGNRKMETYAILDDGSERTMLLHSAAQELGLQGRKGGSGTPDYPSGRQVCAREVSFLFRGISQSTSEAVQDRASFHLSKA